MVHKWHPPVFKGLYHAKDPFCLSASRYLVSIIPLVSFAYLFPLRSLSFSAYIRKTENTLRSAFKPSKTKQRCISGVVSCIQEGEGGGDIFTVIRHLQNVSSQSSLTFISFPRVSSQNELFVEPNSVSESQNYISLIHVSGCSVHSPTLLLHAQPTQALL